MKLLNRLCLLALIGILYSCSGNIMNDEDPASQLKAEEQTQVPSQEFVKSEHIAGYLDARAEVMYLMPQYKDITLQRLGAVAKGNGVYQIETTSEADMPSVSQSFSIVSVKDRAMIYNLATIKDEESSSNTADDLEIKEPVPVDVIIHDQAKCTVVWTYQVSPCTNLIDGPGSLRVHRWKYSTCQTGEDICIEQKRTVRTTARFSGNNCTGTITYSYLKKWACNTSIF